MTTCLEKTVLLVYWCGFRESFYQLLCVLLCLFWGWSVGFDSISSWLLNYFRHQAGTNMWSREASRPLFSVCGFTKDFFIPGGRKVPVFLFFVYKRKFCVFDFDPISPLSVQGTPHTLCFHSMFVQNPGFLVIWGRTYILTSIFSARTIHLYTCLKLSRAHISQF